MPARYNVEILPTAWEDLKRIEDFYSVKFDENTAIEVTDRILDSIERLESYPDSGSLTPDRWLNERGYRMVICKRHVSIYRIDSDIIYVFHILDAKNDYTKLFY